MNTFFHKAEDKKATYKEKKNHAGDPPWKRGTYEVLDYFLTPNRWKNIVTNIESDTQANITSDHFPIWAQINIRLKAAQIGKTTTTIKITTLYDGTKRRIQPTT